jgi:predicted permease
MSTTTKPKWQSRKFWMACATMLLTISVGLGYDIDPEIWASLFGAEGIMYVIIEGIIDAVNKQ